MNVDIVIPMFNRIDLTTRCVETIEAHTTDYGLVLVDNGSEDDTVLWAQAYAQRHPEAQVLTIHRNINYGRATNVGAAASLADALVLLNNDTEVHDGWLEPLLIALANPGVGAAAGRLEDPDGTLQHAGVELFFDGSGVLTARNIIEECPASNDVACLAGTALAIRRDVWCLVGGYDPGYVNGYEDVDLTLRVRAAGYRLAYRPASTVMHHKHASGPSRWAHVAENVERLHAIWAPRMVPQEPVGLP